MKGQHALWFVILNLFLLTSAVKVVEDSLQTNGTRSEKFISLFSIVRFSNAFCNGNDGNNGTCLTATECTNIGGSAAGSCASGFGVCCVITTTTCGSTASYNNTYWRNPGYSGSTSTPGQCSLYVPKCAANICQIRLDFINFTIAGPDASSATGCTTCTQCLTDIFTANGMTNTVPPICGVMNNQHIYLNVPPSNNGVTLNLVLTGTATSRSWNIRVSQIPCGTTYTAPDNCLQWFTDATGTFRSFNYQFSATPAVQHLAYQDYTICIRSNQGFCGICYQVCDTPATMTALQKFLISGEAVTTIVDSSCLTDFIQIPCATDQQSNTQLLSSATATGCTNKICGAAFSAVTAATTPVPVYSYRKPFEVRFFTDIFDATTTEGIGFCLKYSQLPCTTVG